MDGGSEDPAVGSARRRIQQRVRQHLKGIPGITNVRFEESGTGIGYQIRCDVDTMVFANGVVNCDEAYLQVNWWPQVDDESSRFQIHYVESTGFDCGWHRQENDHVDGLDHYQERVGSDEGYAYEAVTFESENPVGLLWEVVDERLRQRHG